MRRQVWWGLETHRHFLPQQHTVNAGVLTRAIILKKKKVNKIRILIFRSSLLSNFGIDQGLVHFSYRNIGSNYVRVMD